MRITTLASKWGQHGFALFLSPDADYPLLDIDGTPTQLDDLVRDLKAALVSRSSSDSGRRSH